ncbi:peptidyl-prolyl cis-trans isomerase [Aquimarina sp. AD1]|uniref:peptidyl-prolyl cis-trans isomerase n=1 Tax=Aquimarina sp. (strain AD1) TaxID=1714848 RepID=UPI000E4C4386|nr:peptidyl-prolyl cis-trans isomerase [Aquimarina sp. AD1]AXT56048.1 peptidyl-prolyl cis-trans isomerase [Aquimarina sp. AD1]RKN27036.1 peptidyl-prolyl cis-trans isomerase [Aquimarina sp. AD1]
MRYISNILLFFVLVSCGNINRNANREVVARVNETYLYKDAIKDLVPNGTAIEDSLNIVNNYINIWATRQLFIDQSKRNLTEVELQEFDNLVEDYKSTLYINAYKDAVINKSINMEVTKDDMTSYYSENLENFILNEELVKLRYLHLPPDYKNIVATQTRFNRFNEEDHEELLSKKIEFATFSFNDSVWVKFDQVLNKIPVLKNQDKNKILKDGKYVQLRDSLGVYMIKIKKVLKKKETAPLDYIKPTIRQIILNKRKRELIKKLEKDITKDAIKNKQFEIYN